MELMSSALTFLLVVLMVWEQVAAAQGVCCPCWWQVESAPAAACPGWLGGLLVGRACERCR